MNIKIRMITLTLGLCLMVSMSTSFAQSGRATPQKPQPTPQASQPVVIGNAQSVPAVWKTYEFKYGDGETLSLILPREPNVEVESENVDLGIDMIAHTITSDSDSTVAVAGYIEVVSKDPNVRLTLEMRRQLSLSFWGFLAKGIRETFPEMGSKAKLTSSELKTVMVYGHEGQQQDFLIGKMPGRYRAVIGERHVYVVVVFSPTNTNLNELDNMIQSFKISPAK